MSEESHGPELALTHMFLLGLDVEHMAETGNENHICAVIQLCVAIATLC